jgi:serine/threonine-protein kinase
LKNGLSVFSCFRFPALVIAFELDPKGAMNEPHDPNRTVDIPSVSADSLDAALVVGFGIPRSSLGDMRPVLLKEAEGESAHVVQPKSDAMPPPEQIGDRYELSGEIARGGMGAVLRGRDVDLGRDLAVKVLLEKYATRPEVARRFIEEAQIGGQLQHPGVVPVYDVGRFGERPFFTMKLVKGKTLAALLRERRKDVGGRTNKETSESSSSFIPHPSSFASDLPRFLGIALQVAHTLAYAHAKGVIHRDLKPANIMVGTFGEVQVMDWGLAKVLAEGGAADEEKASRERQRPEDVTTIRTARSSGSTGSFTDTEAGSLLGTPAYMPPEQANGDVANLDRRADVFGLGAILCEILTGKPPYVGQSSEEVRRKARNGDLADATARLDACGADAELIVLTKSCLAPEAVDRPMDAHAVAARLTAYLDGVQERLHQAELAEAEAKAKAVEEVKRRRLTLALAATVLLAATLGGSGWLYVKNERDARQAKVAREVNDAVNQAMALREKSKAALAGGPAWFAQAREQAQRALALVNNGPIDPLLRDQVERLQTDLDEEEKDRTLVTALDAAWMAQAETVSEENRFAVERAVPKFREAFLAYGLSAGGEAPAAAERIRQRPAAVRQTILVALDEWHYLAGRSEFGIHEPHRDWLRAVIEAAEPGDALRRQVRLARGEADPAKRQAALESLARSADLTQFPPRALTLLALSLPPAQAVDLLRRAQQQHPADFWVNGLLGQMLQMVTPPERTAAVRFLSVAVAIRPDSPASRYNLGNALKANGQVNEAIACFRQAIELDPKYAVAHCNLGGALAGKGQVDKAIACFRQAIEFDPNCAAAHSNLGAVLCDVKRDYDGAIACFKKAIALDPKNAMAHANMGTALRAKRQMDEAITCFRKAVDLQPEKAKFHYDLGTALLGKNQIDEAAACFKKAIALNPGYAQAHVNLGVVLQTKGQLDKAIACYRQAVASDPKVIEANMNLADALEAQGSRDEAIEYYRKAIALAPKNAQVHYNLGNALAKKGEIDLAIGCYRKVIALEPAFAEAHCNLGHMLSMHSRFADALAAYQRGHELGSKRAGWNYPSAEWVRQGERMAALEGKLPAFLKGEFQPRDTAERLGLVGLCQAKKLHATAARLSADAFAAEPRLAADLRTGHRYNAACFAALAAAGQGEDAAKLDDKERAGLRKQALGWLRGDLAEYTKLSGNGPPAARPFIVQQLKHWQEDSDLAGIRDAAGLAKLPAEERAVFTQLWADVTALLKKAKATGTQHGK